MKRPFKYLFVVLAACTVFGVTAGTAYAGDCAWWQVFFFDSGNCGVFP